MFNTPAMRRKVNTLYDYKINNLGLTKPPRFKPGITIPSDQYATFVIHLHKINCAQEILNVTDHTHCK